MKLSKSITIRGGYGLRNFGDDALQKTLHDFFSKYITKKNLRYSCTNSSYLKYIIGDYNIIPLDADYSENTDILIYGGGTQFYSFKANNIFTKVKNNITLIVRPRLLIKKIFDTFKFRQKNSDIYLIPFNNTVIYALGIGIGPFLKNADKRIERETRSLFESMSYISVRDMFSFQKCTEWNLDPKLYSDICYKMKNSIFEIDNKQKEIENVGIIVRDWRNTKKENSYTENIIKFYYFIRNEGYNPIFFIFSQIADGKWITLLEQNKIPYEVWDPDILSFDDYIKSLSTIDVFITARYHGAVFSALLKKPFITINIEPKLSLVQNLYNYGSESWSYPYDFNILRNKFNKINSNYVNYVNNIIEKRAEQVDLAEKMFSELKEKILNIQ